jgi:hypothetical protein
METGKAYMREISSIDHSWLVEIAPHFYEDVKFKNIEEKRRREYEEVTKHENEVKKKIKPNEDASKKKNPTFTISDMGYEDSD